MNRKGTTWMGIGLLTLILVGVVALLAPAGVTQAQDDGSGKVTPAPAGNADDGPGRANTQAPDPAAPDDIGFGGAGPLHGCQDLVANWRTSSSNLETVAQCELTVPATGHLFMIASAWYTYDDGHYEAETNFALDGFLTNVQRQVDVYGAAGYSSDRAMTMSEMWPLASAGTYTVTIEGKRSEGPGTVDAGEINLSVIYIPDGAEVKACGASEFDQWTTNSQGSYEIIDSCNLTLEEDGWVYMMGNAQAMNPSSTGQGAYEGQFTMNVDGPGGELEPAWYNFYADGYDDGTDGTVTVAGLQQVQAGAHTFYFTGQMFAGPDPVRIWAPSVAAIFVPEDAATAKTCGVRESFPWTSTSAAFQSIVSCSVDVPQDSWAFVSANGTLGNTSSRYEGLFDLGFNSASMGIGWSRIVEMQTDAGDGMDRTLGLSYVFGVGQGQNTFHLLGARFGGNGTVLMRNPTLTVLVPGANHFIPLLRKP